MEIKRIKIISKVDRSHFAYDVLKVFHKYDVGIIWMEVYSYIIYIKFHYIEDSIWEEMKVDFEDVPGFQEVEEIDLIAVEERDIEIKKVLDIIPQGVVVLNKNNRIKYVNKYAAERIFKSLVMEITGTSIEEYTEDENLRGFLDDKTHVKSIVNEKVEIRNQYYMINVNPLIAGENVFSGYILTFEDIQRVNGVVNRYDNPISFEDIIGESNKIRNAIAQAKTFARSDSPVLIVGESGTGKELFARSIHNISDRKGKPFIAINCAAMPEQLLESELFGYEEGSFTGGKKGGKAGLLEIVNGGTVFLDEIGEMSPHLQAKLLRVLQERKIRRIGSHKEIDVDFRLVSATHRNLEKMVNDEKFRLDLLYRINIFSIIIPSLRERVEDLPILIEHFISTHSQRYEKNISGISQAGMKKLIEYSWPGNVRELKNVLERAVALTNENKVSEEHIVFSNVINQNIDFEKVSLKDYLGEIERDIIVRSLKKNSSIREAARSLNVTHTLLINRMKKYDILREEL